MQNQEHKSEIRKSYFLNKYVIITPVRALRPRDIKEKTIVKRESKCPFCPENIDHNNIVDKNILNGEEAISLKNIFPAVTLDNPQAFGCQEVIVETPEHKLELADLPASQIENILLLFAKRTKKISRNKKIDYVLCFKNQGSKAGASIVHAHSQIFASKFMPSDIAEELKLAAEYRRKKKSCPYCDIIGQEINSPRHVFSDKFITAFTPYASEYHYEIWIFSRRHLDNIAKLDKNEFKSFAAILKKILVKLQTLDLSFNFFMHQAVSDKNQHFYIKIQPRDSIWAGIELGSGLVINSVPPELAAEYFKSNLA